MKEEAIQSKNASVERIDDTTVQVSIPVNQDISLLKNRLSALQSRKTDEVAKFDKQISDLTDIINQAAQLGVS